MGLFLAVRTWEMWTAQVLHSQMYERLKTVTDVVPERPSNVDTEMRYCTKETDIITEKHASSD